MSNNIYIYHIPGKKIGVTRNLHKRVTIQQGYQEDEYEVVATSPDIDWISKKEKQLQRQYGYKEDFNSYKSMTNQFKKGNTMQINVTEQTVTFPVAKGDALVKYLKENDGFKFMVDEIEVRIDDVVSDWISKNSRTSHFRPTRCYVYNQSLKAFIKELVVEHDFKKSKATAKAPETVFDAIRAWASERGIYEKGDSKTQYIKLMEEAGELARAILRRDEKEIVDSIGDIVVVLTNLAHLEGLTIEDCIRSAYKEIADRKGAMVNGTFTKETLK